MRRLSKGNRSAMKDLRGSLQIIIFQMQGNIIKELNRLHSLNQQLADYLKKIINRGTLSLSIATAQGVASCLMASTCQTRNLLHYKHLDDRTTAEKCLLLALDLLSRLLQEHPKLIQHITHQVLSHLHQHPSCFVSLAFFLALVDKHRELISPTLPLDRLRKLLLRVISNFQESGEIKFLKELPEEPIAEWQPARESLEAHLLKKFKPSKFKRPHEEVSVSQTKIPPLILPSSKSIQSSRYSAISREERVRGVGELRELASAIGEGFIAVELGCLLAHKRTQQVQQFSNNSDYRNKCLQQAETDRLNSSRLSMLDSSYSQTRTGFDKHMDDTNRRYYKKVLALLCNLIHLALAQSLESAQYQTDQIRPFLLDFMDLATVGIIDGWYTPNTLNDSLSSEYFSTIQLQLRSIGEIMKLWGQRVSFISEKKHLKLLWNRNKKNAPFHYEQQYIEKEISDDFLSKDIKVIKSEHMKAVTSPFKQNKEDISQTDFVIAEICIKINQLFTLCDMNNPRFYKYQANLMAVLANYLHNSFSNTAQYIAIDLLFPALILMKRQILQLSHPFLDNLQKTTRQHSSSASKHFSKKEKPQVHGKYEEPLFVLYSDLFCNYLLVISNLMSNHKHVQRLISTIFIKNVIFMQTLQRYVRYLFENDLNKEIKRVLSFYRHCLEIYNQRKLRNQESKSIKILFNHLTCFFYPKAGCIANKLEEKQYLISSSPDINEHAIEEHHFLHELLDFVREIYYYCQDELSQNLLEEDIASFYIKYSLINFIKLYSFITVSELVNLQNDGYELTTKESPHISYHPSINTIYMIDFIRIITSISINRTQEISKKIKQYRILQFFIRQFELEFEVAENIEKYIRKVTKIIDVPQKQKQPSVEHKQKVPSLNLKSTKFKTSASPAKEQEERSESKRKKMKVPALKLPTRSDRSQSREPRGVLDSLIQEINEKPKKPSGMELSLQLTKLNLNKASESNLIAGSSQRNLIYTSQRKIRKIYSNKTLHSEAILLVLSLLLNKGLLDAEYCDQFPITHGKINTLYILHHHLNEESNRSVIPILAEAVGKIKPYLSGQRLLKLLSTTFTDLSHYKNWAKISAGAYGVIYGCSTNIEEPREVAIKQMSFPKSIYERCVLHDIFTEITCLENFRLDDRVTTMYNYGVVSNAYIIVMKKYDCSLRDWILKYREELHSKMSHILKIFWDILNIILLLHQKSVTHYDIKADNILLEVNQEGIPTKVVLGDFGECRLFENSKEELDMKSRGTECIKSPEMLTLALHLKKESDSYDRRKKIGTTRASDIWSLGCLFYEMLTGDYLYHRADWVNFYIQVTSPAEQLLTKVNLEKLQKYANHSQLFQYLRCILIRDPQHRPEIKGAIQKFKDLFGDMREPPPVNKSPLVIQKDLEVLVGKYLQQLKKEEEKEGLVTSVSSTVLDYKSKNYNRLRGAQFLNSYNNSRSNKFMRIMEDIFFCENVNLTDGGYQKIKELKITHIVTTNPDPLLRKFNTMRLEFKSINLAHLAFRLAPKISDLLREVLLLKGRLLFINDDTNYATNLLIYTLSYWFRCSVYETWCLINTQILLFPTFTSDLLSLSAALRLLNDVEERVEELPKLQCICGSVTLILKEVVRSKKKGDLSCRCKKMKINEFPNLSHGPQCVSTGCQSYLQFVKKRYSISWQALKWASMSTSNLLSPVFPTGKTKDYIKSQILLNSSQPYQNMMDSGSCIKTCKVYSCKLCEMMMLATTESKDEILVVMNNMLRRVRQGIMIPNAQESFAKKTPALNYYTLTKLHMTKGPEQ